MPASHAVESAGREASGRYDRLCLKALGLSNSGNAVSSRFARVISRHCASLLAPPLPRRNRPLLGRPESLLRRSRRRLVDAQRRVFFAHVLSVRPSVPALDQLKVHVNVAPIHDSDHAVVPVLRERLYVDFLALDEAGECPGSLLAPWLAALGSVDAVQADSDRSAAELNVDRVAINDFGDGADEYWARLPVGGRNWTCEQKYGEYRAPDTRAGREPDWLRGYECHALAPEQ